MRSIPIACLLAVFILGAGEAWACSRAKPGWSEGANQIIDESERIYIIRLTRAEPVEIGTPPSMIGTSSYLEIVEVIKGISSELEPFFTHSGKLRPGSDLDAHRSQSFWDKDVGRSDWPCCICGPNHTFVPGELYLYFPDKLGAVKSAEIVRQLDDKWLVYVRARVMAANNALERP